MFNFYLQYLSIWEITVIYFEIILIKEWVI